MSQSGDPGGSLELVGLADGQLELVLRGNPDTEYFIETGFQRGQDIEWQPFWIGTLPGGQIAIPVDLAMAGQLFRLRPDSP